MGTMKYKGYTGSVDLGGRRISKKRRVLGMTKDNITYQGNDVNELIKDFEGAMDDYLESCARRGIEPRKPFCGNLNVRITPEIHSRIAMLAQEAGITINAFIRQTLEKAVCL